MAETLIQHARSFFDRAKHLEAAQEHIRKKETSVLFRVLKEQPFTVHFKGGSIECEQRADEKADLKIEAARDTYIALFEGKISPAEAFHQRILRFEGIPYIGFPWLTRLIKLIQLGR